MGNTFSPGLPPAALAKHTRQMIVNGERMLKLFQKLSAQEKQGHSVATNALDTTFPRYYIDSVNFLTKHRKQITKLTSNSIISKEELFRFDSINVELAVMIETRKRSNAMQHKSNPTPASQASTATVTKTSTSSSTFTTALQSITTRAEALYITVARYEHALRLIPLDTYSALRECQDSAMLQVSQLFPQLKTISKNPTQPIVALLRLQRKSVEALEKQLKKIQPDESKWFSSQPLLMQLSRWKRGDVVGNITPPIGSLMEEQIANELKDPNLLPNEKVSKVWEFVGKKMLHFAKKNKKVVATGKSQEFEQIGQQLALPLSTLQHLPAALLRFNEKMRSYERATLVLEKNQTIVRSKTLDGLLNEMKEYGIEQQNNLTVKDENENEKSEVASTSQQHQTAAAASPSAPPLTSSRGEEKETKQETGTCNPAEVYTPPAFTPRLSFGEDVLNLPVASAIAVDTAVMEANIAILDIEALLPQVPTGPLGMNTAAMNVEEEKEEDERVAMSA